MRILFLETVQNFGGSVISTTELAARLNKNHEVLFVDSSGSNKILKDVLSEKDLKLKVLNDSDEVIIVNDQKHFIRNKVKFIQTWFKEWKSLKLTIEEFSPDFIFVNNPKTMSLLLWQKGKFKVVFFARGWYIPRFIKWYKRWLINKLVDIYIAVSESTKQALFVGGLSKKLKDIYVVHNAIENLPPYNLKEINSEVVILHSGGFLEDKGQLVSIEMAKKLKDLGVSFKLILAGLVYKGAVSQNYFIRLNNLIDKYGINENVEIIKDQTDIKYLFEKCHVLIHPSNTEGLPRVVMEAMSFGKPVIANAVGGVTDYILNGYTGLISQTNDVDDYVENIIKLSVDKDFYHRISKNGYDLISQCFRQEFQLTKVEKILLKNL
jgi:glycosyltransferase involved in cell wall biosynthesis